MPLRALRLFPKLIREPATLCIALSGREWAWPLLVSFLEEQTYPHENLHLVERWTRLDADTLFARDISRTLCRVRGE